MRENKTNDLTSIRIGLVGPCAAGKTTLASKLKPMGFTVRQIAQEHSYVPYMWARISEPDVLIFLDVSFKISQKRKTLNWNESEFLEQQRRLEHARSNADYYLHTDDLSAEQVVNLVLKFLTENQSAPGSKDL